MDKIKSIHYLRGIAAILVVCFHIRGYINGVYAQENLGDLLFFSGASGVDLFFIISGFIIAMSSDRTKDSFLPFIIKRLFRIYPVFICTLLLFVVINNNYSLSEIAMSLLFIHRDYHAEAPFFGYNILYPAWTLTYEIYFYIIFCISLTISKKHVILLSSFLLLSPVFLYQLFINGSVSLSANLSLKVAPSFLNALVNIQSSPMIIEFVYGMILYIFFKCQISLKHVGIISSTLIIIYISMFFSGYRFGYGPINFGIWALFLFVGCVLWEKINNIKDYAILNALGDYSYSIYLTHAVVLSVLTKYERSIPIYNSGGGFSKIIFTIACIVIVSYVLFNYIEKPGINIGRVIIKKIKIRCNNKI